MKKIFILLLSASVFGMPVYAQDQSPETVSRVRELIKKRLQLVAQAPVSVHWTNVKSVIYDYLALVADQLNEQTIIVPFDERAFNLLINDLKFKLVFPNVTDEERDALLESLAVCLDENGPLVRAYNILQMNSENQESQAAREAIQHIIAKLQEIQKKAQETRKDQ